MVVKTYRVFCFQKQIDSPDTYDRIDLELTSTLIKKICRRLNGLQCHFVSTEQNLEDNYYIGADTGGVLVENKARLTNGLQLETRVVCEPSQNPREVLDEFRRFYNQEPEIKEVVPW